jgi:hypothetical protein
LNHADGVTTIAELDADRGQLSDAERAEILELWQRRLISLRPPTSIDHVSGPGSMINHPRRP